jgi:hypothetical protein
MACATVVICTITFEPPVLSLLYAVSRIAKRERNYGRPRGQRVAECVTVE